MHISNSFTLRWHLSKHAVVRMQQRSIPHYVVGLLVELTNPVDAGGACVLHRFNADSWAEARRTLGGEASKLDRYRNAYVVLAAEGTVVTAARLN